MTSATPVRAVRAVGPMADRRAVLAAMHLGWILTVLALAVVWIDHATANTLASHIRAGYPDDEPARIASAADTYIVYLSIVGAVGLAAWRSTIRAVMRGGRWIRPAAAVTFLVATSVSLTDLLIRDTSGDTGLTPLLGWVGLLPCLPGLVAVILLWRGHGHGPAA